MDANWPAGQALRQEWVRAKQYMPVLLPQVAVPQRHEEPELSWLASLEGQTGMMVEEQVLA